LQPVGELALSPTNDYEAWTAHCIMANGNLTVVGLGELLWDLFPQGKQLGGAPAKSPGLKDSWYSSPSAVVL
jgi:hypothetical protein